MRMSIVIGAKKGTSETQKANGELGLRMTGNAR
jgi:hypothetical protein